MMQQGSAVCHRSQRVGDVDDQLSIEHWACAHGVAEALTDIPAASPPGLAVKLHLLMFVDDSVHDCAKASLSPKGNYWPGLEGIVRDVLRFAPALAPLCADRLAAADRKLAAATMASNGCTQFDGAWSPLATPGTRPPVGRSVELPAP